MASPRTPVTAAVARPITITPGSRVLDVSAPSTNGRSPPLSDDSIWRRLRDAGFDEDSIRRRDKAALIAYIAKLEAEIYELQHNMGLLILEKKDYASKYEESRLSVESAEIVHLRDQAALSSALSEARKREDNLKKALGIEKECVANIEKALHEMRAECAEVKVSAETKMVEARSMIEDAQKKYLEAEAKLRAAESLQDEARRCERAAGRKLQEVEAREDDLRRQIVSFKADCDAKEKEIMLERQSLMERQKVFNEAQNKLLEGQALLNQREADILSKSQVLRRIEKELDAQKEDIAAERRALMEQKTNLELDVVSVSEREKAIIEKEALLKKKELELLDSLETLVSKEQIEVQKMIAEQENTLKHRRDEFEAELALKQKLAEEEIEKKRRIWELRELDLKQREDLVLEKEQDLEVQSKVIADKAKEFAEKIKLLEEKENHLNKSEVEIELSKNLLQKEREEIDQARIDLNKSLLSLEEERKQIAEAEKKLQLMKSETSELLILETKLKEEIDMIRAQKQQLEVEAEKLQAEKAKFETEWEVIDEKREELRREEERIAGERMVISKFLKDERDTLHAEKEALREQYKRDHESLSHEREALRRESEHERSEWFTKFQQERTDFLLDIECRKRELEDSVNKRREEIESYLKEREKTFEEEMKRDLQHISSLKEDLIKDQELVASELKKLETEKLEIKLDREQREKAWADLQRLIEELQMQRLKLKEQRELLHADREEIHSQIEQLKELEDLKVDCDRIEVPLMKHTCVESTPQVAIRVPQLGSAQKVFFSEDRQDTESASPPSSSVSWLKKCASLIFKQSLDKVPSKHAETSLEPGFEDGIRLEKGMPKEFGHVTSMGSVGQSAQTAEEPKVIHEVPSLNEEATETLDLEVTKDVHESSVPASSEAPNGRKRRADNSSKPGMDSMPSNDEKITKKRRQQDVEAPDGAQDAVPQCVELKQPSDVEGQHIVSLSTLSERSKEKADNQLDAAEGDSEITPEVSDVAKCRIQVDQSNVDKSGLVEDEGLRCVVMKQTLVEEVFILDGPEASRPHESQETAASEDKDPDADLAKADIVKERVRRRSKSKQKS